MDEASVEAAATRETALALIKEKRLADAEALLRSGADQARSSQDWAGLYLTLEALGELLRSRERRLEAVTAFLEALSACRQAHGDADQLGRLIIESEARAEASGMMVAVIVLMLVGVALSAMIWRLQAHLLRWQQHNMVE